MKRTILLVLAVALALATAFGATATAKPGGDAGATASAKKAKGCKKKKGKAKGSATTSAGKKKGKGCKKGNGGGKGSPGNTTPPTPTPPGPTWPPADGKYNDSANGSTVLTIKAGGTQASAALGGSDTCIPILFEAPYVAAQSTPTTFGAASSTFPVFAGAGTVKWSITVTSDFKYTLTQDTTVELPETKPCSKPGVVTTGTLVKAT